MYRSPKPFLILAFTCSLLLAACETSTPVKKTESKPAHDVAMAKPAELTKEISNINIDASGDKIAQLEQQVAALQQEVIAARPKIAKIDVMEQKFKDLSLGLDRIDQTYGMQKTAVAPVVAPVAMAAPVVKPPEKPVMPVEVKPPAAPVEKPVVKVAEKPAPKVEAPVAAPKGSPSVKAVRIGEQKGFSRLVLDLGQEAKVSYDIDNEEKILVIDIPGMSWDAAKTKAIANSPLVASYQAQSDDKGSHLIVQLKAPAKISNYTSIGAVGGKFPRAVLDISPE